MHDDATLERRLRAVERAVSDGEYQVDTLRENGDLTERIETLERGMDDAVARIDDLEAATQALRGYVGNVRSVNQDVERRADAALAGVERLEKGMEANQLTGASQFPSGLAGTDEMSSSVPSVRRPRTCRERDGQQADRSDDQCGDDEASDGFIQRLRNAVSHGLGRRVRDAH